MKAALLESNQQLHIGVCEPVPPQRNEVQIAVSYAGICGTDLHIYHGHMNNRIRYPHIIGHEMSGIVHAVGDGVSHVAPGDPVVVMPLQACGDCPACRAGHGHICYRLQFLGIETPGAFQSYWTVPSHTVIPLARTVSLMHGAMIEPLAVACHDVRMGQVRSGEYAVVLGGGPIGALIALVARSAGARVLISEINPHRLQLLGELGFDTVNPMEEDLVACVQEQTGGAGCDIVFEVTSSTAGAEVMTRLPRARGRIVVVGIFNQPPPVDLHRFFWRELTLCGARVYERQDFEQAVDLLASGNLPLDRLITQVLPLEQLEEGFKQMTSGGNAMKILLEINP